MSEMTSRERTLWRAGALLAAAAIILGAFGAHAVKARVDAVALGWWETAASYHRTHSLGILALAALYPRIGDTAQRKIYLAFKLLVVGLVLFSGSLYLMTLTQVRILGAITPIGGTLWIIAWLLVAIALKAPSDEQST
jgi:uncharacterized membrane protein YgdD (TMEM256/DUF423 family)